MLIFSTYILNTSCTSIKGWPDCFLPCACVLQYRISYCLHKRHATDWKRSTQLQIQAHTQNMPEAWALQRVIEAVRMGEPERKQEKEWLMQILGCVCCEQACLDSLAAGLMTSSLGSSGASLAQISCLFEHCFLSSRKLCKYTYFYVLYPHHQPRLIILPLFRTIKDFV